MQNNISFNRPPYTGNENQYVLDVMKSDKISGDGKYGKQCQEWFEQKLDCTKTLLTPSCTHALEMAAILVDIQPGDEVIMPSYTFVSTANAFVLRGAKIVFVDIRPDTMNMNETLIEDAITLRTKAVVPVHYAGVGCDMNTISDVANRHNIYVIEDAAQGMMATYRGKQLGTFGHFGAYSFHETKNYTSGGEGGVLIINDDRFIDRAEIIREKGTNRSQFFRGMADKYTWKDVGSSYLPSELQAAYLWGQLEEADSINQFRINAWSKYHDAFYMLAKKGKIVVSTIPDECVHNGHMYYIKCGSLSERTALIDYLKVNGISAVFHYVPLHKSPAGMKFGRFNGDDEYTTAESEKIVRLPLWYGISSEEIEKIIDAVCEFYK